MRVLVTGIAGFVGPVVTAALQRAGHDVVGMVQDVGDDVRLQGRGVSIHAADLRDPAAVAAVVGAVAPDAVLHLAGATFVPEAEAQPAEAYAVNLGGTLAVLQALRTHAPEARLVYASSADAYGAIRPEDLPITEDVPLRPVSVYGATKAAAEGAVLQWSRAYGLDVVVVRPFNHTGPGQAPRFVCSAIARQVALAEAGQAEPVLRVGNVDPVRDFSDVRDVTEGYVALLERGRRGTVYNVCAGVGVSIAEVIAVVRSQARIPVSVRRDPALQRPVDIPRMVGSHARATADVGWRPAIAFDQTIGDLLDAWRMAIASGD